MIRTDRSVHFERGPTILLASGNYFDLEHPEDSTFEESDLILGFCREGRFANQTTPWYLVGEHQVHLSVLVERETGEWQLAWDALWHDSPEGIIKDMMRPLKMLCPDYKAVEARIEPVIFRKLCVSYPLDPIIKKWDMEAQLCEKAQLEPHRSHWKGERGELLFEVLGLAPDECMKFFCDRRDDLLSRKAA